MIEELKPCKDCKSPANSIIFIDFYKRYYIQCSGCPATANRGYTPKEAKDNWNEFMSTNLSPVDVEIEALKASVIKSNQNHEHFERLWYLVSDENASLKQQLSVALEQLKLAYAFCKGLDGEEKFHADKLGEAIQQIEGKGE